VMIRQAPREVTAVLNLFLSAPHEIMELALAAWTGPDKRKRAGGSERINRMLGLPLHVDAMQGVRDYFH
jgi:predicted RNA methylase